MKKQMKKLALAKETVKYLETENLVEAAGGNTPTWDARMCCGRTGSCA
jgi:hypothetical protein